jgi:hypothetical protein
MKTPIILFILLAFSACGRKHSEKKPSNSSINEAVKVYEVTQREDVHFVRKEKMVSRFDCLGNIVSHKLETQNSLSKKITVDYENRKNAYRFSVVDTKDKSFIRINQYRFKKGVFTIDYAPTLFNLRVKEGQNEIVYAFERCTEYGKDSNGNLICTGKLEIEKEGIVQIDVTYSSEVLPGEDIHRPSKESCKDQAKT